MERLRIEMFARISARISAEISPDSMWIGIVKKAKAMPAEAGLAFVDEILKRQTQSFLEKIAAGVDLEYSPGVEVVMHIRLIVSEEMASRITAMSVEVDRLLAALIAAGGDPSEPQPA